MKKKNHACDSIDNSNVNPTSISTSEGTFSTCHAVTNIYLEISDLVKNSYSTVEYHQCQHLFESTACLWFRWCHQILEN